LLNPAPVTIHSQILQHYRTSFRHSDFPLAYLETVLKGGSEQEHFLMTLIDAIAADFLSPELFEYLFKSERFLTTLYRQFILAEYLLRPDDGTPISHLILPPMFRRTLWGDLESTNDLWVSSNLTQFPSVIHVSMGDIDWTTR
jgi:regulator-associated protein of mTOR